MPSADGTPPSRPDPAAAAASLSPCSPSSLLFASNLRADRVFQLAQDCGEAEAGQRLAQLVLRTVAAKHNQATQALVRTRMYVEQRFCVVHGRILNDVCRSIS